MKKSDFTGWKEVFSFTFSQTVKQKGYISLLVIFAVIALLSSTVMALVGQYNDAKDEKTSVSTVVIFDETGLEIDYTDAFKDTKYEKTCIISHPSKAFEEYEKQMEAEADETMLVKVSFDKDEETYHVLFVKGKNVHLSELASEEFSGDFCNFFEEARIEAVDISKQQREFINTNIEKEVKELSENGEVIESKKDSISFGDYFILLAFLMICMMIINISANQVSLSIVTEKSSRVIEYLMINVRPLALITGKLLATIVASLLQMVTIGFCYLSSTIISNLVTPKLSKWLFGIVQTSEEVSVADETMAASIRMIHGIKMEYVFLALLFMVLGIVLYGIIAGLLAASVSKMDEMQEAMSGFSILLVVGCYADLALIILQFSEKANPVLTRIMSIIPITAPFLVPGNMLLGKMSWPLIIASITVMLVSIALLFILTACVYEAMIFYNGNPMKFKDIIALAFSKNKVSQKEEAHDEE